MRGFVYLLDKDGAPLRINLYRSRWERYEAMRVWKKLYGHRFYDCIIQIAPSADPRYVCPDTGMNKSNSYLTQINPKNKKS